MIEFKQITFSIAHVAFTDIMSRKGFRYVYTGGNYNVWLPAGDKREKWFRQQHAMGAICIHN